jgi:type II secretory pathway pseudopilin PulG
VRRLHRSTQDGFALIELLAAIMMINIGILTILLVLNSGMVTLRRSAERSTAAAVADKQMEQYRALAHSSIYLDTTSLGSTDSTYQSDSAYTASQDGDPTNGEGLVSQTCSPLVAACTPSQTVAGPDNRNYRIDTFIVVLTPTAGDPVKQVTVVVRKPGAPATLARVVSTFGEHF